MIKSLLKLPEFLFLIYINILFSFSLYGFHIFSQILLPFLQDFLKIQEFIGGLYGLLITAGFIGGSFVLGKLLLFNIIYLFKWIFPNLHDFLDKMIYDKNFRKKVFLAAFILDMGYYLANCFVLVPPFLAGNFADATSVLLFSIGGIFPAYITFLLLIKIRYRLQNRLQCK